ncbi:MAG TPA: hypothetical protein VGY54_03635 [Polyangiaceae bacterium]|jgi:hypothetical protein|nr:hypothetical protein [Polyangiaceae bacterium]
MARSIYRGLVRLQSYVEPVVAERVDRFCAATGLSESTLLKSSVCQYLDGTSDLTLVLRRLDRVGRALERDHRDLEFLSEAFAVFVKLWFAHTARVPEDEKPAARKDAEGRYKEFVEHVLAQFSGGRRFLDDLPRESIADDAELAALSGEAVSSRAE